MNVLDAKIDAKEIMDLVDEARIYLGSDLAVDDRTLLSLSSLFGVAGGPNSQDGENGQNLGAVLVNQNTSAPTAGSVGAYSTQSNGCSMVSGCPTCC